ncbi:probable G-protein coupled receptor Mth-like 11 isoform X1 [Drosophila santomea]|uniref:probable G-protein coupled receptor Mth-like 11 isoform X1 n=1 Tax=Drosophila santomea TaxID=129105 RepID=UPI001952D597|nr:probable G-protein coupled receptor Mth-like 11 isoform X1 [Drosophila santomea]
MLIHVISGRRIKVVCETSYSASSGPAEQSSQRSRSKVTILLLEMSGTLYWISIWSLLLAGIAADISDCDFFDTVDLTHSFKFANGSYRYEDLVIPARLTGEYDYRILDGGTREEVSRHVRGCICKLRPCIRLCCHHKKLMSITECSEDVDEGLTYNYALNITLPNGNVTEKHIMKDMIVQQDLPMPCQIHYHLDAEQYAEDKWTLFENGTLLRHYDNAFLYKQDYCLQPTKSKSGEDYSIVPYNCVIQPSMTMAYVKLASVVFMAMTIGIYSWLPLFHTVHGQCCILYFVSLMATFLLNVASTFGVFVNDLMCLVNGYAGYYAAMATFLWLSVISFDVWRRFGLHQNREFCRSMGNRFLHYNLIVWSTAGILTLGVLVVDLLFPYSGDSDSNFVPAVGVTSCWIMTDGWSGMFYFYGPIFLLILMNGVMFYLTIRNIRAEKKLRTKVIRNCDEKETSRLRANFGLYVYLFVIMGGCWILEIMAFICETKKFLMPFTKANDLINCSQGIIIFLLTICNKEVLKTIRDRIQPKRTSGIEFETCTMTQDCHLMHQLS